MLTISDEQLRLLSTYEDTLGPMLLTLAFEPGFEEALEVEVDTRDGWVRCGVGDGALDRYGDVPMQGYTVEGSGVVVTLALVDREIHIHAQGAGWAIDAEGPYSGWMQSRDRVWPTLPTDTFRIVHAEKPWVMPQHAAETECHEPRIYGPDGPMRIEDGVLVDDRSPLTPDLEPTDFTPAWLKPGYDWERAVVADPGNTLSRIHILAAPLGIGWEAVKGDPRPTHAMMNRIEEALGIETTPPPKEPEHRMVHRLTLGLRVAAAEAAIAARSS